MSFYDVCAVVGFMLLTILSLLTCFGIALSVAEKWDARDQRKKEVAARAKEPQP